MPTNQNFLPKPKLLLCILLMIFYINNMQAQFRRLYMEGNGTELLNLSFYTKSEGYVAFDKWVGYTVDSGRTFSKKYISNSNIDVNGYPANLLFGFKIRGVKAFSLNRLIVYGDFGFVPAILYSTDGGDTYKLILLSRFNPMHIKTGITDMIFPENDLVGYAVDADRILKTVNGGLDWTVAGVYESAYFERLEAFDNNNVITFTTGAPAKLVKTTDGGAGWAISNLPVVANRPYFIPKCVYFLSANEGWVSMSDNQGGGLYKTYDGGASWSQKTNSAVVDFYCTKMKFYSSDTGYAGGAPVSKTVNGGVTWERLPSDAEFFGSDVQFYSPNQFWAGGYNGGLGVTTNAGGVPLPAAYFSIDTLGVDDNGKVALTNFSNPAYSSQWYVNNTPVGTGYNASYKHNHYLSEDTIKLVVTSPASLKDSVTKYQRFTTHPDPVVYSFQPLTGSVGTYFTIKGKEFANARSVSFGGLPAASFEVVSDSIILATIGEGASGPVAVSHKYGTGTLPGFTFFPVSPIPAPVIQSIAPLSGPIESVVTVTGQNFAQNPENNIVFFGSTKGVVLSAAPGLLTCRVPAGADFGAIKLVNKETCLATELEKPFIITTKDSAKHLSWGDFPRRYYYDFGGNPYMSYRALPKDIDGDGKPDLIASLTTSDDLLVVMRNTSIAGRISFEPPVSVRTLRRGIDAFFDINDIDGDGRPDIVLTTNQQNDPVEIYRNTSSPGHISFELAYTFKTDAEKVAVADLDGDGKNDIVVEFGNGYSILAFRNTSSPGFFSFGKEEIITSPYLRDISLGDIDGDKKKEIVGVFCREDQCFFTCLKNTSSVGNISFIQQNEVLLSENGSISLVDFDADSKLDIVTIGARGYSVFRNKSDWNTFEFDKAVNYPANYLSGFWLGIVSNLDGDEFPDVANKQYLAKNLSSPGQIEGDVYLTGNSEKFSDITGSADFDLDGKQDIIGSGLGIVIARSIINELVPQEGCQNDFTSFFSKVQGSSYQWQIDTGTGYHNIVNDDYFQGANTNILLLSKVPAHWYISLYRCLVDGQVGGIYKKKITNYWWAIEDNNWNNGNNWSCGKVPDEYTDVYIESRSIFSSNPELPSNVVINEDTKCRTVTIMPGAHLSIAPGKKLTIAH